MSALALARTNRDDTAAELRQMKEKLTAYTNAVAAITANAHTITRASLQQIDPANPPAWWNDLSEKFTACQGHAQTWIDTIYPSLTRVPQAIIDYNTYFQATTTRIDKLLEAMEGKTPTEEQKKTLLSLLNLLVTKLARSRAEVEAVRADIKVFTQEMAADHKALTTGSASITAAIEDVNKNVTRLKARIEALRLEITALNAQLTAAAVALGASMVVGYVGMTFLPFILIPIAIIGAGVSIGFMTDAIVRLGKTQQEIADDSSSLTKNQKQALVLAAIASTVDALVGSIDQITTNIDVVSSSWATLDAKIKSVMESIKAARDEHWLDILLQEIDIDTSRTAWNQLQEFAQKLQQVSLVATDETIPIKAA